MVVLGRVGTGFIKVGNCENGDGDAHTSFSAGKAEQKPMSAPRSMKERMRSLVGLSGGG